MQLINRPGDAWKSNKTDPADQRTFGATGIEGRDSQG